MANYISKFRRPEEHECADYFKKYILFVRGKNILTALQKSKSQFTQFLLTIPTDKWNYSYAPGKWTLKEYLIHMIDTERIFAYRAFMIARNDKTNLPEYEQDEYIPLYQAASRSLQSIIDEYNAVRNVSIQLFINLNGEDLARIGTVNNNPLSPLAALYFIVGLQVHHEKILREQYLEKY